jgi:hypothetical protein
MLDVGRRCVGLRRVHHRFQGAVDPARGPVELSWGGGGATVFDIASDWTLEITDGRWQDPFGDVLAPRRRELESEVGEWIPREVAAGDELIEVVQQELRAVTSERDEMGEVCGVRLAFETADLRLFGWAGDLIAELERRAPV